MQHCQKLRVVDRNLECQLWKLIEDPRDYFRMKPLTTGFIRVFIITEAIGCVMLNAKQHSQF